MASEELMILIAARAGDSLEDRIHRIAPMARLFTRDDLEKDPSLIEQVEIVYGSLKPGQLAQGQQLKWIQTTGAGVDWVQSPQALSHPVVVTNARIHAAQISEHLFGMLLMLIRKLHESYRKQREHIWEWPKREELQSLPGKTLCVLGLGVIGRRCAMLGKAHGMRVIGVRRHPQPTEHVEEVFGSEQLDEALKRADVIMNLLPGTSATGKMIGKPQFDIMRDGAIFLNAGRGSTVDTEALLEALRRGKLAGAALDVVDPEPLPKDHPLWDTPNVIITPHCAGVINDYHAKTERLFLDNLKRYLSGDPLQNVVDKEVGY